MISEFVTVYLYKWFCFLVAVLSSSGREDSLLWINDIVGDTGPSLVCYDT